jgi:predicted transposase/invertase (TIGR01784 family)
MTEINEKTTIVDEALALTEEATYTAEELEAYDRNWDSTRTEKTLIEDKLEEGFERGLEKGKEEKAFQIARNSLVKGWDVEIVVDITGLDLSTVLKIQESLK